MHDAPHHHTHKVIEGLEYVKRGDHALTGDLYLPADAVNVPGMVAVHGGAWQRGQRANYRHLGRVLADHGIVDRADLAGRDPGAAELTGDAIRDRDRAIDTRRQDPIEPGHHPVFPVHRGMKTGTERIVLADHQLRCRSSQGVRQRGGDVVVIDIGHEYVGLLVQQVPA